ncbi:hypothetical protein Pan216_21360 [Planctomycetes bacterium Pan216]|uniref:Uncharacterized protein n=1 Tax=Kolteria novifilia TaxID=2527975 RepID=A0A518B2R3_9BACT|nr:hypothetical protein Pan216_21360 [Planctomycetes bacterium Pan216]
MPQLPAIKEIPPLDPLPDLSCLTVFNESSFDGLKNFIQTMRPDLPPVLQGQLDWCSAQLEHIQGELPGAMTNLKATIEEMHTSLGQMREKINDSPKLIEEAKKKRESLMKRARAKMSKPQRRGEVVENWHEPARSEVIGHFLGRHVGELALEAGLDDFHDWAMESGMGDLYDSALVGSEPSQPRKGRPKSQPRNWSEYLRNSELGPETNASVTDTPEESRTPNEEAKNPASYASWHDWLNSTDRARRKQNPS